MNEIQTTKIEIPIQGMTCANCAARIDKELKGMEGIINSNVNLATDSAILEFNKDEINFDKIKDKIEVLGYKVFAKNEKELDSDLFEREVEKELSKQKLKFKYSLFLTIPIIILNMDLAPLPNMYWILVAKSIILFTLTSIVIFWCGWQFYKGFYKSVKNKYADMNTLVSIGTGTAYLFSTYILINFFFGSSEMGKMHLYYDTSATIITFILLGKLLEKGARGRSTAAIKNLLNLRPKNVNVYRESFKMTIPVEYVNVDDIIEIIPGEKIPVDGIIISGNSYIDESLITGESIPIEKKTDDMVIGGTINKFGSFKFRAQKVGKDTYLSQIIKLVKDAQGSKAPIQKYADKIASIFVPAIIIIAILTFVYWNFIAPGGTFSFAIMNFVSVLIIACPCALGLATPTAIITGIGKAAEYKIFFKNSESLESVRSLDTIIFDKTGTITKGELDVVEVVSFSDYSESEILKLAASCESQSEHPIGKAIVKSANLSASKLFIVADFEAVSGYGIKAKIHNHDVHIGNADFLKVNSIFLSHAAETKLKDQSTNDKTIIFVVEDRAITGMIFLSDTLKTNVKESVQKLKDMHLNVGILSGDNKAAVDMIAKSINIDIIYSQVKPEQKLEIIKRLQSEGKTVAMVGDGVNDAPALIQADVGIALGSGTDVAISSSDITLASDEISSVYDAILISKKTIKIIRQNLFWAFFYNIICIPIAAGVFYPSYGILLNPAFAALTMAFSSVSVVSNSLRLLRINLRKNYGSKESEKGGSSRSWNDMPAL